MIEVEWWDYDDIGELSAAVAGDIGFVVESAIDARGDALIALPGGAAAAPMFARLAETKLDWKKVTIIPTDDRLVAVDSPLSKVATLARHFLPLGARVVPISSENADYKMAGRAADARLADLHWPPDLVWLTAAADGHTASILPGPDLDDALAGPHSRRALGLMPDPLPADAPVARVTLSRAAIVAARALIITGAGSATRALLERAIADGPLSSVPIGRVLADAEQPIDIHWAAE